MRLTAFAFIPVLALAGAGAASGQTPPAGAGLHPIVEVHVLQSRPTGTTTAASGTIDLRGGATTGTTVYTLENLCGVGIGDQSREPPAAARNVWRMTADLVGVKDGVYSIHVRSQVLRSAADGRAAPAVDQVLTLREGDRVFFDMLRDTAQGPCDISSATIDASLRLEADDPARDKALFATDLWLVHRDASGEEHTQHLVLYVDGATPMAFRFADLLFPLPKLDPKQLDFSAFLRFTGTLREHLRADGLVDVDLTTTRALGLWWPAGPTNTYGGNSRKILTMKADETTAIEIPQPGSGFAMTQMAGGKMSGTVGAGAVGGGAAAVGVGGRAGAGPAGAGGAGGATVGGQEFTPAGEPAQILGDKFVLNTGAFFKTHVTRVIVRVHRVR